MTTLILFLVLAIVPEPGILFHGIIRDDSCLLQAETPLHWTFTPVTGGDTLRLTTQIEAEQEVEGLYNYKVLVPLATPIEGSPTPEESILVTDAPVRYLRHLQVEGSSLMRTDTITLSAEDRGTFQWWSLVW
ncbi:MAG: hypothetical protein AAF738_02475 [Bacteroidota bacterium]